MASKVPALTRSAVLKEVQHGDNTLRIVGYVESIQGQTVGPKRCLSLFKFVITNGELKVKVLIWEDQIPTYAGLVKFHEMIEFVNIKAVAVNTQYQKTGHNFVDYDSSVQRSTVVICHGELNNSGIAVPNKPEKIQIKHAAAYQGVKNRFVAVEGYLCVPFVRITTGKGTCSFASGAVSDGAYKLRLQVANYEETAALVAGAHVAITGTVRKNENGDSVFMQLEHMEEIRIIYDFKLSSEEIEDCFRKPLHELPALGEIASTSHELPASDQIAWKPSMPRKLATRGRPHSKSSKVQVESESEPN